jgi:tRNA modification GTPase
VTHTDLADTIVALATPPGQGALAIIRVSGPRTFPVVDEIFIGADLQNSVSHTIHFGHIKKDDGTVIDELLVFLFKGPSSYTGEDVIEISCHGSQYIIQEILELVVSKGIRLAKPGEFTMRAFLNGKMDLSQAEAVADLIASTSKGAHDLALQQMRGGFSNRIKHLRERLIHFASMIELELDFAEEDVEFANRDELKGLIDEILKVVDELLQSFQLGNAIRKGVSTVIAGRPNAGKSTLLNRLLKEDRAIVSHIAGTTRDTIEEILNIGGVEFRLIDTAGIREATDQIESLGVAKTMEKVTTSLLLLYVFDVVNTSAKEVKEDLTRLVSKDRPYLVVANKMDLKPYVKAEDFVHDLLPTDLFIPVSAINDMNIEYLKERLFEVAIGGTINQESLVVTNTRHVEALSKTKENLLQAQQGIDSGISSDFVAMDIRQAIHFLGEITGEISTDDLLENIFRNFCIGK